MGNLQLSSGSLFANRFEIKRAAGSGGMGTVYRATDRYSGETVALKLLHTGVAGSDEADRFAREAQLLSELRHSGIVAHVAHGQTPDGQRFLAMEWLEGQDLSERLMRGPLPVRDCLRLFEQIADALSVAHQRGIIHRDLKPSNLFLIGGDFGRVKILDFGIARRIATSQAMTKTGMVVGTPEYMAPEQARGSRDLTPAADFFSLGCVLYECLTGQPPFVADHIAAVLVRILFEKPTPIEERRPGVPPSLSALVDHLLVKHPAERLADAAALRTELLSLVDLPEPALAATMASPKPKVESFAEEEQSLLSIVLAAPAEEEIGIGMTMSGSAVQLEKTDRQALLQALAALGGSPDFLANGTLVVTVPSCGSAQDQAIQAARAALLIKERWPDAVVSMATGRGAVRRRTAVGEVVELAARSLKSESHPSAAEPIMGVWIDPLSAKLLTGRFTQTPQPGGALLLHEERDVDTSRPLLGKPTPCVGREAELNNLEGQLAACVEESEARVVLITAPPGAGKSRLLHEFLRRMEKLSEPATMLLGRGELMNAGAPYGILRAAIQKLCGIAGSQPLDMQQDHLRTRISQNLLTADSDRVVWFIGELCNVPFSEDGKPMLHAARQDPKIMREGLRRAVLDFLTAECGAAPVLLVLDDLQWGDEPTVSILDEALRELSGTPLFVLSFARPEVHEAFPKLWQSHKVQEIPLKGLSKKACERLIVQVLGNGVAAEAVARAIEQSGGNALFLEEIIRSIAEGKSEGQSETVVAMLQARLGRLDGHVRRAVRAAAVFGETFWRGGVAALLGRAEAAPELEVCLSALVGAEFIQPHAQSRLANQSQYGFRHALARDAAYSLLTSSDLFTGHRLAAEFLESAGELNATVIAEHFERSGDRSRAARCYLRAAEDGSKRGDYLAAMNYAKRGLDCRPDGELLGWLCSIKSYLHMNLYQYDQIGEAADVALKLLRVGSQGWCRALGPASFAAAQRQDRTRAFEAVSLWISTEPDTDARAEYIFAYEKVFSGLLIIAPMTGLEAIRQRLGVFIEQLKTTDPTMHRCCCLTRSLMATFREPGPWTLVNESQRNIELSDLMGDTGTSLSHRGCVIEWGWLDLGDREGAEERMIALTAIMEKTQKMATVGLWRHLLARVFCLSNEEVSWAKAEQIVAPLCEPTAGFGLLSILAQGVMARLSLLRGRLPEAEALARALIQFFPVWPIWLAHIAPVQIRALLGMGRPIEAVAGAVKVLDALPMLGGLGVAEVEFRLAASEAFHASGDIERARTELQGTLRQVQLRADDITDSFWKSSYLTRNPYVVRAQQLAKEWGLDVVVA